MCALIQSAIYALKLYLQAYQRKAESEHDDEQLIDWFGH